MNKIVITRQSNLPYGKNKVTIDINDKCNTIDITNILNTELKDWSEEAINSIIKIELK